MEYSGEIVSLKEGLRRQENYDSALGSFLFFYKDNWLVIILCLHTNISTWFIKKMVVIYYHFRLELIYY